MIKAFDKDGYCPMKLKVIYLDKTHSLIPSQAMDRGVYFETLCLGSGVNGKQLLDLPRKRNGDKTVAQERIEMQAKEFVQVLSSHKMTIIDRDVYLEAEIPEHPGILCCGTIDFTSSIWDDVDGPIPKGIFDLKLTQTIYSQFGPYCWHFPHNMDHTQAFMYTHLWKQIHGEDLPFYYLVFDYKPTPEYKIVKKIVGKLERYELAESVRKTIEKINHHEHRGYFTNPMHENCRNCPLADQCPDVTRAKKIQSI